MAYYIVLHYCNSNLVSICWKLLETSLPALLYNQVGRTHTTLIVQFEDTNPLHTHSCTETRDYVRKMNQNFYLHWILCFLVVF